MGARLGSDGRGRSGLSGRGRRPYDSGMRVVVQRVSRASVTVDGSVISEIGTGLLCLVGVEHGDGPADASVLATKISGLRIFGDDNAKMNRSVLEVEGAALVVSQFTLYGDVRKGRRPSFTAAAEPSHAAPLVAAFGRALGEAGVVVAYGSFGAMMEVGLVNDGPVTLVVQASGGRIL